MKLSATLIATISALATASATSVLLPLYVYPSLSTNAWGPVYDAASSNPDVDFYIVVNPDSGPGGAQYPNSDYVTSLARLNSFSNVYTLGYVHTGYTSQPAGTVASNITKYAGWSQHTPENITVKGIFFDEVDTKASSLQYYSDLSTTAYQQVPGSVVLNPGVKVVDTDFYQIADEIVVYECIPDGSQGCATYQDQATINDRVPAGRANQSSILLRAYPYSAATLSNSVAVAKQNGIAGFYATTDFNYGSVSLLGQIAGAIGSS